MKKSPSRTIQIFGKLEVRVEAQPVRFRTRPTESLVALLSCRAGNPILRTSVASSIWPDVEDDKAASRLRTTLFYANQALEPLAALITDRTILMLDAEVFDIDLLRAERLYRQSRVEQDVEGERASLGELLKLTSNDFLQDWPEEWTREPRDLWRRRRVEALLRSAQLAADNEEDEVALALADQAVRADEYSEEGWAIFLRCMATVNRSAEAVDRFRAVRERRRADIEIDFSPELIDLAKRTNSGQGAASRTQRSPHGQLDFMAKVMSAQATSNPVALLPILAAEDFKREAFEHPLQAWTLLQQVIDNTAGTEPDRLSVMLTAIGIADMVDEYGTAFDYGEWLIENTPEQSKEHRYSAHRLGFISFEMRDWQEADRYLQHYRSLCERYGDDIEQGVARTSLAALAWHLGDVDIAEREYSEQLRIAQRDSSLRGLLTQNAYLVNLGGAAVTRFDWATAESRLSRAYAMAVANKFDYIRCSCLGWLGFSKMMTGDPMGGRLLVATGLTQSYRSRYNRIHQIAGDASAAALANMGRAQEAEGLLQAFAGIRAAAHHMRSPIEERIVAWIRESMGPAQPRADWLLLKPAELVAATTDVLDPI